MFFMGHNDLDLQKGGLKLYVCLPVVLKYQAEYVLLKHNQKYVRTIAFFRNGSAYLMKGHNQHGNVNDVMFTFLHFVQLMYGTSAL